VDGSAGRFNFAARWLLISVAKKIYKSLISVAVKPRTAKPPGAASIKKRPPLPQGSRWSESTPAGEETRVASEQIAQTAMAEEKK